MMKSLELKRWSGRMFLTLVVCCALFMAGCYSVPKTPEIDAVRQPAGDVEEFWDAFDWGDLSAAEQALWGALGWDEARWIGDADEPASEEKNWEELNDGERAAARQLGYTQEYWDEN